MSKITLKAIAFVTILAFLSGPAFAANTASSTSNGSSNTSDIIQNGDGHNANVLQNGNRNDSDVLQNGGPGNNATVRQGQNNDSDIVQTGRGNRATVDQLTNSVAPNTDNISDIDQIGNNNQANVSQDDDNFSQIRQTGNLNQATVNQTGFVGEDRNTSRVFQRNQNVANVTQQGTRGTSYVNQNLGNNASVFQTGAWNNSYIVQNAGNRATVRQLGQGQSGARQNFVRVNQGRAIGDIATAIQSGGHSNRITINQENLGGNGSVQQRAFASQNGTGNRTTITQNSPAPQPQ